MSCTDGGTLRAFLDGELVEDRRREVERHLANCRECQRAFEQIRDKSDWAEAKLTTLSATKVPDPDDVLSGLRHRLTGANERRSMLEQLGLAVAEPRYRLAAVAVALLLALSASLAYLPVQSAAESFLAVFRVQKFEAVQVDPVKMPKFPAPTNVGEFTFTQEPTVDTVASVDEARKRVDFGLRVPGKLPSALLSTPTVVVSSAGEAALTVDLDKVNAYLASIGATNVNLPPSLDGATIKAKLSPLVGLIYSDKSFAELKNQAGAAPPADLRVLFVAQGRSPVVEAPANLDFEQLRSQILQIPGLPPEFVAQIRDIKDWKQTALVPVIGETSKQITVDGSAGLLITSRERTTTVAMWQKSDVLYVVGGNLAESEILEVANSLK